MNYYKGVTVKSRWGVLSREAVVYVVGQDGFLLFVLYIMAIKFDVISSVLLRSIFLVSLRFCESYLLGIEIEIIVCVKPLKLFKHFLNLTEREKENFTILLWKMGFRVTGTLECLKTLKWSSLRYTLKKHRTKK